VTQCGQLNLFQLALLMPPSRIVVVISHRDGGFVVRRLRGQRVSYLATFLHLGQICAGSTGAPGNGPGLGGIPTVNCYELDTAEGMH
jgi:hypothetical protein